MGSICITGSVQLQMPVVERACEVTRGADRAEILRFACRFMEFGGWLFQDAGDLTCAMHWTDRALDYALELGDPRVAAYTLMRKALIATEAGNPAYSGLRWGELVALTAAQVDTAGREITVDRKVVEVAGRLFLEAPKGRKRRRTIYPRRTPAGYPLAVRLAARIEEGRAEQEAGTNPLGLVFPSPKGMHWRSSNFSRRVLASAYLAAGWRDADGYGEWTWHSLRHVFCTTALFTWRLDPTDVSRMAGHANYRTTLDMYVGATAGVLDRARAATE
jgi:integrase